MTRRPVLMLPTNPPIYACADCRQHLTDDGRCLNCDGPAPPCRHEQVGFRGHLGTIDPSNRANPCRIICQQCGADIGGVGDVVEESTPARVPDLPCPKCGDPNVTITHLPLVTEHIRYALDILGVDHTKLPGEMFRRTCQRCRFQWATNDVIGADT